jgi:leader peptidase (prepilin peptidase) / N-methyltransferase
MNLILVAGIALAIVVGWLSAAAVNYFADILPDRRRIVKPFCLYCEADLPIDVYLLLRRCPACGRSRHRRAWVITLFLFLTSLFFWFKPPSQLNYWVGMLLLIYLGVVTVIDFEHRLILYSVSLTGALLGLAIGISLHGLVPTLLGGLAGFGAMLVLYLLGFAFLRLMVRMQRAPAGEDEALGFGDVALAGVMGLLLGWPGVIAGLVLAILLAGVASLGYLVVMALTGRYHSGLSLAYGPFLVAGVIILLYFRYLIPN